LSKPIRDRHETSGQAVIFTITGEVGVIMAMLPEKEIIQLPDDFG
jgi:hypothetical protein